VGGLGPRVEAKTGDIVWHYQWTPAETYDYDGNNENVLADIMSTAVSATVLMHADRTAFCMCSTAATASARRQPIRDSELGGAHRSGDRAPGGDGRARRLRSGEKVELKPRWTGGKKLVPMAFIQYGAPVPSE